MTRLCLILFIALVGSPALAVEPSEMLADPALEARAQEIGKEVRCLVCRNESIEDSNADLARDLRLVIRERLTEGDSDSEVLAYLSDRFGDFVRLRPRFGGSTLVLWLAGPALLIIGGLIVRTTLVRRKTPQAALSSEEQARLDAILKGD